jgi:hypothetical protein
MWQRAGLSNGSLDSYMLSGGGAKACQNALLHSIAKGAWGETEDWWNLVTEDDGKPWVEHEWSYHDLYGKREPDTGVTRMTVEEFLNDKNQSAIARNHLASILAKPAETQ